MEREVKAPSTRTTPEKFEKAALFLRLGLPSILIRHENDSALQTGGTWLRWIEFRFRLDRKIRLKMELFKNEEMMIIM